MTFMICHLATFLLLVMHTFEYVYDFMREIIKHVYALPAHQPIFSRLSSYSNITTNEYAKPLFPEGKRLFFHCTHSSLIIRNNRHSSQNVLATFLLLDFFDLLQRSRVQFSQALIFCLFFHQRFSFFKPREGVHRVQLRGVRLWHVLKKAGLKYIEPQYWGTLVLTSHALVCLGLWLG